MVEMKIEVQAKWVDNYTLLKSLKDDIHKEIHDAVERILMDKFGADQVTTTPPELKYIAIVNENDNEYFVVWKNDVIFRVSKLKYDNARELAEKVAQNFNVHGEIRLD